MRAPKGRVEEEITPRGDGNNRRALQPLKG